MHDPVILRLYSCVLHEHINTYGVNKADIRTAIQNIAEVYKPNPGSLSDAFVYVANFNDAAHRIAYLHKYAPLHTALVSEMLSRALQENPRAFQDLIFPSGRLAICSLGGGPGSDIFGVLSVLTTTFGLFQVSATVIDCMDSWKYVFYDLINELRYGNYGALGECVGEQYFDWKYLQHNLLDKMTDQVNAAIGRANLVTMIKFVSASSCKDTSVMIKKIFAYMKPGALVVYIDNAGGGFHSLVAKEADNLNFKSVFYQKHEKYAEPAFGKKKFGYTPCCESRVSIHIWSKAFPLRKSCSVRNYSVKKHNLTSSCPITVSPPKKYINQLHNETLIFSKRVYVSSTAFASSSKFIDTDNTNFFQDASYFKYSTDTIFASSKKNYIMRENSPSKLSGYQRKEYPRDTFSEETAQYRIAWHEINKRGIDIVSKQTSLKDGTSSDIASDLKNIKTSEKLLDESFEPPKKSFPEKIHVERHAQYGIIENNIGTNCSNSVCHDSHVKYKASPANVFYLKNVKIIKNARDELPDKQKTTVQTQDDAPAYVRSQNSSSRFSWVNRICDVLYQEFILLITGEFISADFAEEANNVGDSFYYYLFETA